MSDDDSFSSEELSSVIGSDDKDESLSDTLAEAFKADAEDSVEPPESEPEQDTPEEPSGDAASDEGTEEVAASGESTSDEETDQTEEGETSTTETPPLDPPARFSELDKITFLSLPRESQEFIVKRNQETEAAYTRKTQELAVHRKTAEDFAAVVKPYEAYMASLGVHPLKVTQVLLAAEHTLRTGTPQQKIKILAQFAKDYDVNLDELSDQTEGEPVSPEIAQLNQRQTVLERQLHGATAQANLQVQTNADTHIKAFAEERNAEGQLLRPFFEDVRVAMGSLVDANFSAIDEALKNGQTPPPELDMQTAYENAAWANPQLREAHFAMQRKEAEQGAERDRSTATKQAEQERKEKAKKAKKAALSVKAGAEPPGPGTATGRSLEEEIRANFEQALSSP